MVPKLVRLLFSSVRTGAVWATEMFVSYCEFLVRSAIRTTIAIVIAIVFIRASISYDANWMLLLGVVIGGVALVAFAVVWSIVYMSARAFSNLSEIAKEEIEKLSNVFFLFMLTLFYLGINQAQRHPAFLKVFLAMMFLLFITAILPGQGRFIKFFRTRFQLLILVPVVAMSILTIVPEAITDRVSNGYLPEKLTGTVAGEISFRIDEQDQIIDLTTGQPMELFERVSREGESPKPLKGWTKDKQGNYHLWTWFAKQTNSTSSGQKILPITTAKIDDIVIETKRAIEKRMTDEKKAQEDEALRLKAEEDRKFEAQRKLDERAQAERLAEEERRSRPVEVTSKIMAPVDQSEGMMVVQPTAGFVFRGQEISPPNSIIVINVVEVKETSDKNKYSLLLQPEIIVSNGVRYDISRNTDAFTLPVKKDNSRNFLKIAGGAIGGAVIGGLLDGKEGFVKGAIVGTVAVGTVYSMSRHGKKFQLTVGDPIPTITIRP